MAEGYDRIRPSYPSDLFDAVFSYADLPGGAQLLESGAGTGKATMVVAPRAAAAGWTLTCVEPDPAMAAVLRGNLASLPHLDATVIGSGLEEFATDQAAAASPRRFSLLYAAQSWHWVAAEMRAAAAADLLEDGGTVALIWNVARPHPEPLKSALDAVYARVAWPTSRHPADRTGSRDESALGSGSAIIPPATPQPFGLRDEAHESYVRELAESGAFSPLTLEKTSWEASYEAAEWASLLETHSDHRLLDEELRSRLLEEVAGVIDSHGGSITVVYDTVALLSRRLRRQ